jgi:predicted enzyme related to lactoylglutathione lyase
MANPQIGLLMTGLGFFLFPAREASCMPRFLRSHLRILTSNFQDCFRFYSQILQLPLRFCAEELSYAEFRSAALHVALFDRQAMAEVLGRAQLPEHEAVQDKGVVVLRVEDVDQSYILLKQRGVKFITCPQDRWTWGCRTAHFSDPAGTVFELNADLQEEGL